MVEYGETHSSYEEGNPINGYLTTIKNTIANKLDKSLGKNLFDKNNVTKGYFINSSGVPQSNSSYFISDYIPLNGKKIVSNYTGSGGCMAVYDKDFNLVAALGVMNENSIIDGTLDNYIYCKVSANLSIIDKLMLEYGETHSDIYEEYNPISPYTKSFQKAIVYPSGSSITKDSIVTSGDDTIRLYNLSVVKNNYSVEFYGLIDSSSITLDVGVFAGDVTINTSNISYGSTSVAHGLTLKNFLSVSIVVKKYGKGDVTICTNGGTFTINDVPMTSVMGGCYAKVTLGTINNASLAFHSDVYSKSTWLFGDSYMDIWPPYIYDKYTDIMYNGYGGYSAANAYNSFIQALNYGKPKRVIWAIGMNNWESSWDSHTDSYDDWVLYTTKVVEYCEGNSIELIFITAPSTPEHSNSKKTSYTKTTWSTHKIIDVNEAVVKDSDTNEWYEGMLASDSIHPTEYGAVSIARFIDSHLNELT